MEKKIIYLLGAMGAGKSTILKSFTPISNRKYWIETKEGANILGINLDGADTLSKFKKSDVLSAIKNASGVFIIAGIFYSSQKDIDDFINAGFEINALLLQVDRDIIYKRVLNRGSGNWNETTYNTNLRSIISLFKLIRSKKKRVFITKNNLVCESLAASNKLKQLIVNAKVQQKAS